MNPLPPLICGTLLVAMVAAGFSHHWSVETFVKNYPTTPAVRGAPASSPFKDFVPSSSDRSEKLTRVSAPGTGGSLAQEEFFNTLLTELRELKNENRDLRDLMGETNRDVMNLAFRVDSHSESFRPLPASEERGDNTSFEMNDDEFPGVLPPKASPVYPLDE